MTNNKQSVVMVLGQLLDWYDCDEANDNELERIVAQARAFCSNPN